MKTFENTSILQKRGTTIVQVNKRSTEGSILLPGLLQEDRDALYTYDFVMWQHPKSSMLLEYIYRQMFCGSKLLFEHAHACTAQLVTKIGFIPFGISMPETVSSIRRLRRIAQSA